MALMLPNFSHSKVLVMGDVMLDRYWHGNTERISPEAPVPVVHVKHVEERPGGAGNVALNLAAVGVNVHLLGLIGQDENGQTLQNKLNGAKVRTRLRDVDNAHTITKLRVISVHQQLIRLDFEDRFTKEQAILLHQDYTNFLNDMGAVILSDYGKGSLIDVPYLIKLANQKSIPVFIDPKGRDFSLYQGATLLTPNLREFELVVGHCETEHEMADKARKMIKEYDLKGLLVTRGAQGMTLFEEDEEPFHLPAHAREVYDVTGAGDTVIALLAATVAAGADLKVAVNLANRAAGIVVGKLGTATVSVPELQQSLLEARGINRGVLSQEQLLEMCAASKKIGEKIVFTNGCFDVLHAGHVGYLEEAKALGDRLIVAVNDDASVSRLKGSGRPINTLERRMAVLAGLSAVDWVVSFSEDTPQELIEKVLPNVLVKGGDYRPEQIAGSKAVLDNGGEVKVLGFLEGCSSTAILEKMKTQEKG
jgi:D-beta-D-heptose 7-phosphate kinase / D-beta-D-heptose 1-phosphate adenosyltransferase